MNRPSLQQNNFVACEEARCFPSICDPKDLVVCPKPRVGIFSNSSFRPVRCHASHLIYGYHSKSGAELHDIILMEEGIGLEHSAFQVASSPPFYSGSPPSRASNPLIQDSLFRDEKHCPFPIMPIPSPSSPSSTRKSGRARLKFGLNPGTVRVEGFDCLNRDSQNSSIPAVA